VLRLQGIDINIIPDNEISNRVELKPMIILSNAAELGCNCVNKDSRYWTKKVVATIDS